MDTVVRRVALRPAPALRPWVASLWFVSDPSARGWELRLPTLGNQLLINLAADRLSAYHPGAALPCRADGIAMATVTSGARVLDRSEQRRLAAVVFRPGGAAALLGISGSVLRTPVVPMDTLWGRGRAGRLRQRCQEAESPRRVLDILHAELLEYARHAQRPADLSPAINGLAAGLSVERLAADLGVGVTTLQRRFRHGVGVSPKRGHRLLRLEAAVAMLSEGSTGPQSSLAAMAYRLGFHDQAHFTHDFADLTGLTPGQYLRTTRPEPFHLDTRRPDVVLQDSASRRVSR